MVTHPAPRAGKDSANDVGSDRQQEEPPARAWPFFVAIGVVIVLIIAFVAGRAFLAERQAAKDRVNGFDFQQEGKFWVTRIEVGSQPYDIPFYYHPHELTDVVMHANVTDPLLKETPQGVVISVDPDAGPQPVIAGVEIARITGSKYDLLNLPTQSALSRKQEGLDTPVVTCADANPDLVVIQLVNDPAANAIVRDGSCVILFYKTPEDSVRVADRYAYALLRIVP